MTTSKATESTTEPQDASQGTTPPLPSRGEENALREDAYLSQLADKLTEWQQVIFNSASKEGNFIGLRQLSHEVQVASYEVRILQGVDHIEAKLGAGMTLTAEEQQVIHDRNEEFRVKEEEERRKESVARSTHGLHHQPVKIADLPQGRRADREG